MKSRATIVLPLLFLAVLSAPAARGASGASGAPSSPSSPSSGGAPKSEIATFAGGCFWCEEATFEGRPGVISVTSGYTGGTLKNPTYEDVGTGTSGHFESVRIVYDPAKTSYAKLLDLYWHNIDPTQKDGQFCDRGSEYRSVIFYHDETQRRLALETEKQIEASGRLKSAIVTLIEPAGTFYPAEDYHQDFYKKNPGRYHEYRTGCGRDARLLELWGKLDAYAPGIEPHPKRR